MKRMLFAALLLLMLTAGSREVFAQGEEPAIYVIQKGDTLWGLSERFLKDPYFWPDLWSRNQRLTNPHFIFPGQKLRIYPDRIEVVEPSSPPLPLGQGGKAVPAPLPTMPAAEEAVQEKTYMVSGSEGFLLENGLIPAGFIISTNQNRQIVGEDDIVYTDFGKAHGVKVGDRFSIYKKLGAISHPVTNVILGYKVIPLGSLQVSETEEKVSKAIITKSFMEIGAGAYLMPYTERKREVALKSSDKDLAGYIVETQTGNKAIAAGDVAYLDIGRSQGISAGNMLYVVRDVVPDQKFLEVPVDKLPAELIGAVVIVETGEYTSTALVVKSIDTIYRGDRVELKKSK